MKTLALIIAVLVAVLVLLNPNKLPARFSPTSEAAREEKKSDDPIQSMAELRSQFPNQINVKSAEDFQGIADVRYDVKKTDSLVNPLLGSIRFHHCGIDLELVFHWKENHWVFTQIVCLENGRDFTDLPGGREIIDSPEMRPLMARCR